MNNLDKILESGLLRFKEKGTFFFIQIFQRRKDNPDLEHGVIRLKSYCVYSIPELLELMPRIEKYCQDYNARAYIRLNSQNATDITLRCIEQLARNLREGNAKKGRKVWDSVSGQGGKTDYWVIDIDWEHHNENMMIVQDVKNILKAHFEVVRKQEFKCVKLTTKSGTHLIVEPFDKRIMDTINRQFQDKKIPNIQIQKDANTLLYTT